MKKLLILSVLLGCLPLNLMAQEFTGNVVGVVSDSSGAVVPGATVIVSGETIQGVRSTMTERLIVGGIEAFNNGSRL